MPSWLLFLLQSIYLILPGMCANMAPVIVRKLPFLAYPVDGGMKFLGQPLFGKNKTYRGFFFGILASICIVYLQKFLYRFELEMVVSIVDYSSISAPLFGFLIGFGVLLGDLIKSFFKRRLTIAPGARFFPWDQLDSLIGGLVLVSFVFVPPITVVLFLFILIPAVHIGVNHIAFYLGLKETKW